MYIMTTKVIPVTSRRFNGNPSSVSSEVVCDQYVRNYVDPEQTRFFNALIPHSSQTRRHGDGYDVLLDRHDGSDLKRVEFRRVDDRKMWLKAGNRERAALDHYRCGDVKQDNCHTLYVIRYVGDDGTERTCTWDVDSESWIA